MALEVHLDELSERGRVPIGALGRGRVSTADDDSERRLSLAPGIRQAEERIGAESESTGTTPGAVEYDPGLPARRRNPQAEARKPAVGVEVLGLSAGWWLNRLDRAIGEPDAGHGGGPCCAERSARETGKVSV